LQKVGFQDLTPQQEDFSFDDWWAKTNERVDGQVHKGLKSIIILGAWAIWNHHNCCVFDGILPSLNGVLEFIREELLFWCLAGARGFHISSPLGSVIVSLMVKVVCCL